MLDLTLNNGFNPRLQFPSSLPANSLQVGQLGTELLGAEAALEAGAGGRGKSWRMLMAALLVSTWPWGWSATYIIVLKARALRGVQGTTCTAFLDSHASF